jgi:dolichol kinase
MYALVVVALGSALLAWFAAWSFASRKGAWIAPVLMAAALGFAASGLLGGIAHHYGFELAIIAALGACLVLLYKRPAHAAVFALAVLAGAYAIGASGAAPLPAGAAGIGIAVGVAYKELTSVREDRSYRRTAVEIRRDKLQILIGIAALPIILYVRDYWYVLLAAALLLYMLNSYSYKRRGALHKLLSGFERHGAEFGFGATALAAGTLMILGFTNTNLALFGISSLVIGDAAATIAGISLYRSRRMPHNRRKTYAGTMAFFTVSSFAGVLTLGIVGIMFAAVLALVESAELPIDDNITIPAALLALVYLLLNILAI